jgi:hypothetical protein
MWGELVLFLRKSRKINWLELKIGGEGVIFCSLSISNRFYDYRLVPMK